MIYVKKNVKKKIKKGLNGFGLNLNVKHLLIIMIFISKLMFYYYVIFLKVLEMFVIKYMN